MTASTSLVSYAAALLGAIACSGSGDGSASGSAQDNGKVEVAQSMVTRISASAVPASALDAAVAANNAFAVDLYAHLAKQPGKNILTAPISASLALTMGYMGAAGTTKSEMATALHLDPAAGDAAFTGQNALSQALEARAAAALAQAQQHNLPDQPPAASDYQLQVVNSVWGQSTYTWERPFLDTLAADYGTGVYQQDFVNYSEPARIAINDWVDTHTNDKIKNLLPAGALDSLTRMVLVNALHLKLPWAAPFNAENTVQSTFTREDASTLPTDFMNRTDSLAYADDGQAQVVSLPLSNDELSVVIALPHADVTIASYEAALTAHSAALATPNTLRLVALSLPKATFTSDSFSLSVALKAMGMKQAFDRNAADLSGLCAHPPDGARLYVDDVIQKDMISMQETGIEAAAATAVVISGILAVGTPEPAPVPVPMNVNRPYLVAIVDNPTGAILMLGHIEDPTDAGGP